MHKYVPYKTTEEELLPDIEIFVQFKIQNCSLVFETMHTSLSLGSFSSTDASRNGQFYMSPTSAFKAFDWLKIPLTSNQYWKNCC